MYVSRGIKAVQAPKNDGREAKYGERIDGAKLNYEAGTKVSTMGLPTAP
jgi:hypothetical protein